MSAYKVEISLPEVEISTYIHTEQQGNHIFFVCHSFNVNRPLGDYIMWSKGGKEVV